MHARTSWCWCCACRVRRRRRVVIALLIAIIAVAVSAHDHTTSARPHSAPTPPAKTGSRHTPTATQTPARPTATSLAAAGQGLTWISFDGMQLPISATAGPRHTRGGLASGFADTPRGALLAAINIGVRTAAQWGTATFRPTITRQVTGPDTAALLRAETSAYTQLRTASRVRPGRPAGRGYAVEDGYRFVAWSPASATVDIVTAGPTASGTTVLASTRVQVLWQRGDWRVVAPPSGNWANAATAISALAGYTTFPRER